MNYVLLVVGMLILIYGANLMVKGASSFAKMLGIPNIIIGLTVVAFGTSFPELMINIFASMEGKSGLAVGNVIGSNIINVLLVIGIAAFIKPLEVQSTTVRFEIPFSLLGMAILFVVANDGLINGTTESMLLRSDGIIFLAFFMIFIYYTFVVSTQESAHHPEEGHDVLEMSKTKSALLLVMGMIGLYFGGDIIVDSATIIAAQWGLSEMVVGILVVALGTSLPELATSAVASYKGNADMAIGNIVGSNIFNVFLVLGVSSTISPISFDPSINPDLILAFVATLLLLLFVFTGKGRKIDRKEATIFILLYIGYVVWLLK
ncbi:MAG: sodium:proton exchanger [Bacteroidetes bacterium 4572_77]|nr:MAG: sodium:proton exchanger [Bacteroidetes bacterium 4572_77]